MHAVTASHSTHTLVVAQLEQQWRGQPQQFTQEQGLVPTLQGFPGSCAQSHTRGPSFQQVCLHILPCSLRPLRAATAFMDVVWVMWPVVGTGACWRPWAGSAHPWCWAYQFLLQDHYEFLWGFQMLSSNMYLSFLHPAVVWWLFLHPHTEAVIQTTCTSTAFMTW